MERGLSYWKIERGLEEKRWREGMGIRGGIYERGRGRGGWGRGERELLKGCWGLVKRSG